MWIKESQRQLVKDRHFPTWRNEFGLYCDDERVWRCGGRLNQANISPAAKHPIILPREHHLTVLIVQGTPEVVPQRHQGDPDGGSVKILDRQGKIPGEEADSPVQSSGPHYKIPPPPPLPEFRVSEQPPFTFTGVDFAGPLYVHYPGGTETSKVWLCLFTCCVIWAIHLDLVPNMTTTAFLRCLKKLSQGQESSCRTMAGPSSLRPRCYNPS